jgi:hypothetical protein
VTLFDLRNVVVSNMASFADSFNMTNKGASFFETEYEMRAVYQDEIVPYIVFQEEGFKHYLSGKLVKKNKGFISVKATGKINRIIWAETNGLQVDYNEENQALLENQNNILVSMGGMQVG